MCYTPDVKVDTIQAHCEGHLLDPVPIPHHYVDAGLQEHDVRVGLHMLGHEIIVFAIAAEEQKCIRGHMDVVG